MRAELHTLSSIRANSIALFFREKRSIWAELATGAVAL
jgi:hypothetical protein